jgi:hypothetical protein
MLSRRDMSRWYPLLSVKFAFYGVPNARTVERLIALPRAKVS